MCGGLGTFQVGVEVLLAGEGDGFEGLWVELLEGVEVGFCVQGFDPGRCVPAVIVGGIIGEAWHVDAQSDSNICGRGSGFLFGFVLRLDLLVYDLAGIALLAEAEFVHLAGLSYLLDESVGGEAGVVQDAH